MIMLYLYKLLVLWLFLLPSSIIISILEVVHDTTCTTDVDCAMNGRCVKNPGPGSNGNSNNKCICSQGWKGSTCEELDLLPVNFDRKGLQLPDNQSTWGGSILYFDNVWYMFASQMVNKCGLNSWTTNSQVILTSSSSSPYGPYQFEEVLLPTFAHEPNVIIAPSPTNEIVMFVTMRKDVKPRNCTTSTSNDDDKYAKTISRRRRKLLSSSETGNKVVVPPPKDTYMLYSKHPKGPWSEPQLVINSTKWNSNYWSKYNKTAICDTNLNGIILDDNSFLGIWRKCETPDLLTIPHTITASNWKDPNTYQPHTYPIFPSHPLGGSGAEDPSNIWLTRHEDNNNTNNKTLIAYHVLFHDEQTTRCMLPTGCSSLGKHAFSIDNGQSWRYAADRANYAYTRNIEFVNVNNNDNTNNATTKTTTKWTMKSYNRARPHVVIDSSNGQLIALSTGLQPKRNSDYVWTLVQPIRG